MANLDEAVRKFRGYWQCENDFDELDFKKEVWEFIQSTCMDIIGQNERKKPVKGAPAIADVNKLIEYGNAIRTEQRARLIERIK